MADVFDQTFLLVAREWIPPEREEAIRDLSRRATRLGTERFLPEAAVLTGDIEASLARTLSDASAVLVRHLADREAIALLEDEVSPGAIEEAREAQAKEGFRRTLPEVLEVRGAVGRERRFEVDASVIERVAAMDPTPDDVARARPSLKGSRIRLDGAVVVPEGVQKARSYRDILRRSLLPSLPSPAEVTRRLGVADVELTDRLGAGPAGALFAGRVGSKDVACRVVCLPEGSDRSALVEAGGRAARLGGVRGLARVFEVRPVPGGVLLVRERVEGPSLAEEVGTLGPGELVATLEGLAVAVDRLHGADLVHGAVHPGNVVLSSSGPVLVDLELQGYPASLRDDPHRAPELDGDASLLGGAPAADLFGLGATLHHAITGEAPGRPVPSLEESGQAPGVLGLVVDRLVAPDPADRIADGAAVVALLGGRGGTTVTEEPPADEAIEDVRKTVERAVPDELMEEEGPSADDLLGETFGGRYEILAPLGKGGMGVVYRARQTFMDREVALKLLGGALRDDGETVHRFRREAKAAARIDHENVVQTYDAGELEGRFFIAMEFVPGGNLKDRLREEGALPVADALDLMRQILGGVGAAHELGIVHRDLKGENVLLREVEGRSVVKVTDFGLAHLQQEREGGSQKFRTQAGVILGTAEYMSPEQASGQTIDARTDLYSAGVILFEMLTGDLPFRAKTLLSYLGKHLTEPPPSLAERAPEGASIPEALEDVVARALSKDPGDRFQTAEEFAEALTDVV